MKYNMLQRFLVAASVSTLVACAGMQDLPSAKTYKMYDTEVVLQEDGSPALDENGNQRVKLTNEREVSERMVVLQMQKAAVDSCAKLKGDEMAMLADAIKASAGMSNASAEWARTMAQRDLITALDEDFDTTGCTQMVSANSAYWNVVRQELRSFTDIKQMQYGLGNTALKVAGFAIITNNIGDTLVGLASSASTVNIGNRYAGGGSAGGGGVTPQGVPEPGETGGFKADSTSSANADASGDTDFSGAYIQLPDRGSVAQTGEGIVVMKEGNQQTTDGQSVGTQGQIVTDPIGQTQPSATDEGSTGEITGGDNAVGL